MKDRYYSTACGNSATELFLEEIILFLYAVIASIVILKYLPWEETVTHEKIRYKGWQKRQGNYK